MDNIKIATFALERLEDKSGVSGTGIVAHGVQFVQTGKVVLAWITHYRSISVYDNIDEMMAIHGYGGRTRIVWNTPEQQAVDTERQRILYQLNRTMENNGGLVIWEKVLRVINNSED